MEAVNLGGRWNALKSLSRTLGKSSRQQMSNTSVWQPKGQTTWNKFTFICRECNSKRFQGSNCIFNISPSRQTCCLLNCDRLQEHFAVVRIDSVPWKLLRFPSPQRSIINGAFPPASCKWKKGIPLINSGKVHSIWPSEPGVRFFLCFLLALTVVNTCFC